MGCVELGKKLGEGERQSYYMRAPGPPSVQSTVSVPETRYNRGMIRKRRAAHCKGVQTEEAWAAKVGAARDQ